MAIDMIGAASVATLANSASTVNQTDLDESLSGSSADGGTDATVSATLDSLAASATAADRALKAMAYAVDQQMPPKVVDGKLTAGSGAADPSLFSIARSAMNANTNLQLNTLDKLSAKLTTTKSRIAWNPKHNGLANTKLDELQNVIFSGKEMRATYASIVKTMTAYF